MADIEELKNAAAPVSLRIALATEDLVEEQKKANKLLGDICEYKQQQKDGDIKFRKGSTLASLFSIAIALTALYIVDGAKFIAGLF